MRSSSPIVPTLVVLAACVVHLRLSAVAMLAPRSSAAAAGRPDMPDGGAMPKIKSLTGLDEQKKLSKSSIMRAKKSVNGSDTNRKVPKALDAVADQITKMSRDEFELSLKNKGLREGWKRQGQRKAFAKKAKDVLGDVDKWDAATLEKMGSFLLDLDLADIQKIPAAAIAGAAANLGKLPFGKKQKAKKFAMEKKAIESLGDAKTWNKDKMKSALSFVKGDRKVLNKVNKTVLADTVADLGKLEFEDGEASFLAKKLRETDKFKDLSKYTADTLADLGNITKGLGSAELELLPEDAIVGAFDKLKKVHFRRKSQKHKLLQKAKKAGRIKSFDKMTTADLEDMGELVEGLTADEIKQMPASAVANTIKTFKNRKMDRAQKAQLIEKVKKAGNLGKYVSSLGPLVKNIGLKDIRELDMHDLGLDNDNVPVTIDPLPQQAMDMFDKVKRKYGRPGKENRNYTSLRMKNWGKIPALGMNKSDIENLENSEVTLEIFESFAQFIEEITNMQEKAIGKKIREIWKTDSIKPISERTEADVRKIGKYLKHFDPDELGRLDADSRAVAAQEIGNTSMHNIGKKKLRALAKFALKNVLRNNTIVTDATNADALTTEDLMNFGSLLCGLDETEIAKLTTGALEDQLFNLADCPFEPTRMKALYDTTKAKESDLLTSPEKLAVAGPALMFAPKEDLDSIDKAALSMVLPLIIDQFDVRDELVKRRQELSIQDMSDQDLAEEEEKKTQLLRTGVDALLSVSGGTDARRRRSTGNLECNEIEALGSGLTSLTTSHIESIADSEFLNCGETLGSQSSWSSEQLAALSSKAKQVYGSPSTWSAESIGLMGSIVAGLSVDEIKQLQLHQIETVYSVGQHGLLSADQRQAGVERWVSLTNQGDFAAVTSAELKSIGHFACGMTPNDISQITSETFGDSAAILGTLDSCDPLQMAAYATKAKDVYGSDVSTWPASTITEVGYFIGGLSKDNIASLDAEQVAFITPMVLKHIPVESFTGFSSDILKTMSESQAKAVTSSQMAGLDSNQRLALISAGADPSGTGENSGNISGGRTTGLMPLALIVMLLMKIVAADA